MPGGTRVAEERSSLTRNGLSSFVDFKGPLKPFTDGFDVRYWTERQANPRLIRVPYTF